MTVLSLIRKHDRLEAELRMAKQELDAARREWSDRNGYRVPVRVETFRREMGA